MYENILDFNNIEARSFFYSQEAYINFDLPKYIDFRSLLTEAERAASAGIGITSLNRAKHLEGVNHTFLTNKDGRLTWRKLEIINPVIYASLVELITRKENWLFISKRMSALHASNLVNCVSIPAIPFEKKTQSASQVMQWIDKVEKSSIKLALDYDYLYITDITDCYGSMYTHTIPWALHGKAAAKEKRQYKDLLGNKIDHHIQAMSHGQTNGIPQGSILMDFIAEIVLAFVDEQFSEKLREQNLILGFEIIRYRDDYRVFVKDAQVGEKIMKILSEVLGGFGMRLNSSKTKMSNDIISSAIKADKLFFLEKTMPDQMPFAEIRKQLIFTYRFAKQYPNSAQINRRLNLLRKHYTPDVTIDDPTEIVSILAGLAFDNPACFPSIAAFISKAIEPYTEEIKLKLIRKVKYKLSVVPNAGFLEVWLQRLSIKIDKSIDYNEKLCKFANHNDVELFNNSWLDEPGIENELKKSPINKFSLKKVKSVISSTEVELFREVIPS